MAMNGHETFDARVRATHDVALARLSPQTQAQLAQRRRHALVARSTSRARPGLRWAVATLAVCAVAIGVFRPVHGPTPSAPPLASVEAPAPPAEAIDDNPDFYLWLASSDANSLASE
jgi:hypothetical protein